MRCCEAPKACREEKGLVSLGVAGAKDQRRSQFSKECNQDQRRTTQQGLNNVREQDGGEMERGNSGEGSVRRESHGFDESEGRTGRSLVRQRKVRTRR
jgi:alpha-D-ribose 1-methylphosphonate 5-triphosphate synthase subunit PhnG